MNRTILVLPFMLLSVGCSNCWVPMPLFETAPVAGDADGLRQFEGRWFDEEGNLVAVVSSAPEPRLYIQTLKELEPKDVRLQNGEIVFRLGNHDEVFLRLIGEDKMQVSMGQTAPDPRSASSCSCQHDPVPVLVLVRNPSPTWYMKLASQKIAHEGGRFARRTYARTWDWLARTL